MFDIQILIISVIALLIAITVHEAAHAWMAFRLGDPTAKYEGRVSLNPLVHLDPMGTMMIILSSFAGVGFGWGKPVPYNPHYLGSPRRDSFLIAIAGPGANFITAIIFAVVFSILGSLVPSLFATSFGSFLIMVIDRVILLNVALLAFNILPIPPLDGSKLLAAIVPPEYDDFMRQYFAYGPMILIFIVIFGRGLLASLIIPIIEVVYAFINFVV